MKLSWEKGSMQQIQRAFYEMKFLTEFLKRNGTEFQTLFEEIMEKRYPGDFQRVRPWGNIGDRKCDGYLKSKRCLYQVYAPDDMKIAKAITKIEEDFAEALPFWKKHFDSWVFVHNAYYGLAADVLQKLLDLEQAHTPITLDRCGFAELRLELFQMDASAIASILGPAPELRDMLSLGFDDLRPVLLNIGRQRPVLDDIILPVPLDKLDANGLSESAAELLRFGMQKATLVQRFFDKWHDPTLGDSIAQAFKLEYLRLKALKLPPDEIFCELQVFAGGERVQSPMTQSSVLVVLAYLFERCHIFEASRAAA